MTAQLTDIFRHPVKSHGRERLESVTLEAGKCLPWDRVWAVAHDRSKWDADDPKWMRCVNFLRGSNAPQIQAIDCALDERSGTVTFRHPRADAITAMLDDPADAARFIDWLKPLASDGGRQPVEIAKADQGFTDAAFPCVSLLNHSSRRALSQKAGQDLSALRFRGNIWFDGLGPWEEFEWVGRELKLGNARLRVAERIPRCQVTAANTTSGRRDADPPAVLRDGWGHEDFGVVAEVIEGGLIAVGDTPRVI